jgi:nucleotide-binding universal stress UspA family protein
MSRKILVPIELTSYSINVLRSAQAVKEEKDELILLHVVLDPSEFAGFHVPHISMEQTRDELMEDAEKRMERFVSRYARGTRYILEFGFAYMEIPKVARREKANLIVIGSKQNGGGAEHLFVRSISKKVLRDAPCEVMVVPLPVVSEEELESSVTI